MKNKKKTALIEMGKDGSFSVYTPDIEATIIGEGATVAEAKSDFENVIFINGEKRVFPDYTSAYLIGFTKDGSILLVLSNSQEAERVILRNDTVYKISEK